MIAVVGIKDLNLNYELSFYEKLSSEIDSKILIMNYITFKNDYNPEIYTSKYIIVIDEKYISAHELAVTIQMGAYFPISQDYQSIINQWIANLNIKYQVLDQVIIDPELNQIIINDETIKISSKEMEVFIYLMENRGVLCTRENILVDVLKYHPGSDSRIVDVYIKYLRSKLGQEGKKIETIRGKGYVYNE